MVPPNMYHIPGTYHPAIIKAPLPEGMPRIMHRTLHTSRRHSGFDFHRVCARNGVGAQNRYVSGTAGYVPGIMIRVRHATTALQVSSIQANYMHKKVTYAL